MNMKKIEEAGYILELKSLRNNLRNALTDENSDNIYIDAALQLPGYIDQNYMDLMILLDDLELNEDSPKAELETLREYAEQKIDERMNEIYEFLKNRIRTVEDNIKYLKDKFKKDWGMSYKKFLEEGYNESKNPLDMDEILDKINKTGMDSLTKEERNFLRGKSSGKGDGDKGAKKDDDK